VLLVDGELVLYLERGGRALVTWAPFYEPEVGDLALGALATLVRDGRVRRLQLERIDGVTVDASPHRGRLEGLGFRPGYRGLVLGTA
jgi:ATP-dependent Lhr-like helicase